MITTPVTQKIDYLHACIDFEEARERLYLAEREIIASVLGPCKPLAAIGAAITFAGIVLCIVALFLLVGRMA